MTGRSQTGRRNIEGLCGDAALLARLRDGDEVAFDSLLRAYGDGLLRYATSIIDSPDLAQDVVQDVFLRLWQQRAEVQPEWDIAAYLYGRTRHLSINATQSQRSAASREERWSYQLHIEKGSSDRIDEFSDDAASLRAEVWNALAHTAPRCREIFMLIWDRQLRYAEIAHSLGMSERTVRNYASRAMKTLFQVLGPRCSKEK